MTIYKTNCPVPFDQQPLNEYLSLKKTFLFSWSLSNMKSFLFGCIIMFTLTLIFISCFLLSFLPSYSIWKVLFLDLTISSFCVLLVFVRLYLGWSYIVKRLLSATIFYEESGWYDGQIWVKTSDYLMQDRLVGFYQIMPHVLRIKYTCFILIISCLFSCIFYKLF